MNVVSDEVVEVVAVGWFSGFSLSGEGFVGTATGICVVDDTVDVEGFLVAGVPLVVVLLLFFGVFTAVSSVVVIGFKVIGGVGNEGVVFPFSDESSSDGFSSVGDELTVTVGESVGKLSSGVTVVVATVVDLLLRGFVCEVVDLLVDVDFEDGVGFDDL